MEAKKLFEMDSFKVINKTVEEELICPICLKIFWQPVACSACESHYCDSCIKIWSEKSNNNSCTNRCEYKPKRASPILISLLSKLKFKCIKNDCLEEISYSNLSNHEDYCPYFEFTCYGCKTKLYRYEYDQHIESCSLIAVMCKICKLSYKKEENHDKIECLSEQVSFLLIQDQEKTKIIASLKEQIEKIPLLNFSIDYKFENFKFANNSSVIINTTGKWECYTTSNIIKENTKYYFRLAGVKESTNTLAIAIGLSPKFHNLKIDGNICFPDCACYIVKNGKFRGGLKINKHNDLPNCIDINVIGVELKRNNNSYDFVVYKNYDDYLGFSFNIAVSDYYLFFGLADNTSIKVVYNI